MLKKIKRSRFFIWIICFILCLATEVIFNSEGRLYYDALDYWNRGAYLWKDGSFSLIMEGFRGYVFPVFLGICIHYLGGMAGWKILNAAMVSTLFSIMIPSLQNTDYHNEKAKECKVIICYLLFTFFFMGLEIYPLSDLPAIFLCLAAVFSINYALETSGIKRGLWSFLFGVTIYCSYNVRTIYQFAAVYLVLYIIYQLYKHHTTIKNTLIIFVGGGIGVITATIPQIYMNYYELGKFSIKVPTSGLMKRQLFWGMQNQAYGTYVGIEQEIPQMYFVDKVGMNILQKEGITDSFTSIGQYLKMCLKYPIEMVGIYTKHLINMLLPIWPEAYVVNMNSNKIITSILAFSCIFLFIICVFGGYTYKSAFCNFIPILIPVVFITPGAVEIRFFAALYIYTISTLCWNCDWKRMFSLIAKNKIKFFLCYIGIYASFVAIWTNTLASISTGYPIFFE